MNILFTFLMKIQSIYKYKYMNTRKHLTQTEVAGWLEAV